jgi:hypothetical protein
MLSYIRKELAVDRLIILINLNLNDLIVGFMQLSLLWAKLIAFIVHNPSLIWNSNTVNGMSFPVFFILIYFVLES